MDINTRPGNCKQHKNITRYAYFPYFFQLILAVSFLSLSCQESKISDDIPIRDVATSELLVPIEVNKFLQQHFPEWSIADTADYSNVWWSFYAPDQTPHIVVSDLNDDAHPDYGLILKRSDSLKIVILLQSGNTFQTYTEDIVSDYTDHAVRGIHHGVKNEPPGRIDCIVDDMEKSLIMRSNGIALMDFEIRTKIYYWAEDRIHVFEMK